MNQIEKLVAEPPTTCGLARKITMSAFGILILIVIIELFNQLLFFASYRSFVWTGVELFNIRGFTQRVNDQRYVTIKPNFTFTVDEGWGVKPWTLSTDAWGFRKGTYVTNPACASIGFIGASVPFGWGVSDSASLPSKLFNRIKALGDPRCVFNAAIPSYALSQTIARFEIEIYKKFNVQTLYLQLLDPTSQLLALGAKWQPEVNWTNFPAYGLNLQSSSWSRYSATLTILDNAMRSLGWRSSQAGFVEEFSPDDEVTLKRFEQFIRGELERLHTLAIEAGVRRLILASFAAPREARKAKWYSKGRHVAIAAYNSQLRDFAATHPDTRYLDTQVLLDKYPDDEVYVDSCCHLTERGNDILAQAVVPLITAP
jgi:hypothetical protein